MSTAVSLRWKAAGAASLLLISITLAIALSLVRYQRSHLAAEGRKRVESLAQTLAVSARDPLLEADELRLGPVVQSIMQDPDAVYAYVLDHAGTAVYHSDTSRIGEPMAVDPGGPEPGILEAAVPVLVEGTAVGTAYVGLSAGFVDAAAATTARAVVARLGLGILVGLASILLLADVQLQRIGRLEQAVGSLAAGDRAVRAEVSGHDELARLGRGFNTMVESLERARQEVERGVTETVAALASTIEVNDTYTRGHCERVALGTLAIAERVGVEPPELRDFELAARLHDIGKIGVPTQVLSKKGRLTKAEFRQMQEHAALGARILASVSFLGSVARFVRSHHENWDGSGYPDGLRGEETPLAARIIHVVDAYDAMTSTRSYRMALSQAEAVRRIADGRGTQFDPALVDVFLDLVADGAMEAIRRRVEGVAA